MILRVYHSTQNRFDEVLGLSKADYKAVAKVLIRNTTDIIVALEQAFAFTNHIHQAWWDNEAVTKLVPENVRSTSVGDLVEELETGELWMCGAIGWTKVKFD